MAMTLTEKAAYIKGLADGLDLNKNTAEGKILAALLDLVNDITEELEAINDDLVDLQDYIEEIDEDLECVEDFLGDSAANNRCGSNIGIHFSLASFPASAYSASARLINILFHQGNLRVMVLT